MTKMILQIINIIKNNAFGWSQESHFQKEIPENSPSYNCL